MIKGVIFSASSGVYNVMWTAFLILGGQPSFILELVATLVYLLEPLIGLYYTLLYMLFYSIFKEDAEVSLSRGFKLQTFAYLAEAVTGILNVLKLQAQGWADMPPSDVNDVTNWKPTDTGSGGSSTSGGGSS